MKIKNGEMKLKNGEMKIKNGEMKIKNGEMNFISGEMKSGVRQKSHRRYPARGNDDGILSYTRFYS
jgi:N-glycosylase/DNA lyase